MAGRRRGTPRLVVAGLGQVAGREVRRSGPGPRPGQGAAQGDRRCAGELCEGEELGASLIRSFPRKREPRLFLRTRRVRDVRKNTWIPASAGMSGGSGA